MTHPIRTGVLSYEAPRRSAEPQPFAKVKTMGNNPDLLRAMAREEADLTGLYPRVISEHRSVDLPLWDSVGHMPVDPKIEAFVPRTYGTTQTSKGVLGTLTPNLGMAGRYSQFAQASRGRSSDVYVGPAWVKTV